MEQSINVHLYIVGIDTYTHIWLKNPFWHKPLYYTCSYPRWLRIWGHPLRSRPPRTDIRRRSPALAFRQSSSASVLTNKTNRCIGATMWHSSVHSGCTPSYRCRNRAHSWSKNRGRRSSGLALGWRGRPKILCLHTIFGSEFPLNNIHLADSKCIRITRGRFRPIEPFDHPRQPQQPIYSHNNRTRYSCRALTGWPPEIGQVGGQHRKNVQSPSFRIEIVSP